jgi:hypothetical protein
LVDIVVTDENLHLMFPSLAYGCASTPSDPIQHSTVYR